MTLLIWFFKFILILLEFLSYRILEFSVSIVVHFISKFFESWLISSFEFETFIFHNKISFAFVFYFKNQVNKFHQRWMGDQSVWLCIHRFIVRRLTIPSFVIMYRMNYVCILISPITKKYLLLINSPFPASHTFILYVCTNPYFSWYGVIVFVISLL